MRVFDTLVIASVVWSALDQASEGNWLLLHCLIAIIAINGIVILVQEEREALRYYEQEEQHTPEGQ